MKKSYIFIFVLICSIVLFFPNCGPGKNGKTPDVGKETQAKVENKQEAAPGIKLVLTVVVDQFRADMVEKMKDRFGKGGFRYLMDNGTWCKNTHLSYCTTLTAVGHATIYTGALPAVHGIVGNYWFDKRTGEVQKTVIKRGPENNEMVGPYLLEAPTIGDQLVKKYPGKSRVFSVSMKDRAAILPGGQQGKAFWYNRKDGSFTTSDFYYQNDSRPGWMSEWNSKNIVETYRDKTWNLFEDPAHYICKEDKRPEEETCNKKYRNHYFPHDFSRSPGERFFRELACTPFGDELVYNFAVSLMEAEEVGRKGNIDMMAISFSVTDIIGHTYGPCSLEYEDNLLHLDALLAKLFDYVEKKVGLKNTLIVLASDHGVGMIPEYAKNKLGKDAGRLDPALFAKAIDETLSKKYTLDEKQKLKKDKGFTLGFRNPSILLNLTEDARKHFNMEEMQREAAKAVEPIEGVAMALAYSDLKSGNIAESNISNSMKAVFHPERSGDILVVQKPNWFLYHEVYHDSAMHGAPYNYDNHVPLFFAGPGIPIKKTIEERTSIRDMAATVIALLGLEKPSQCSGKELL